MVLTQPHELTSPFEPGTHFVAAPVHEMPEVAEYYLNREAERQEIADNAWELVSRKMTVDVVAAKILTLAGEKALTGH